MERLPYLLTVIFTILLLFFLNGIAKAQTSFNISNKTTGDTLLTIDNNGNVGIGTNSPETTLDVQSDDPGTNGTFRLGTSDLNHYLYFYSGRAGFPHPMLQWNGAYDLRFGTSFANEYMRLTSDGNLGIGTTTPTEMLEVADTIYSSVGGFKFPDETVQTTAFTAGSGNTLDQAYDQGGAGNGSIITADAGAVTINGVDGLLSTGTYNSGSIPVEGAGLRMMWYPGRGAFRAGRVAGAQWNAANIGGYSSAFGYSTTASGSYSTALGIYTTASGNYSTALGQGIEASGSHNVAIALSNQSGVNVSQDSTMAIMGGKVGIGIAAPMTMLHVADTIYSSIGGFKFPDGSVQTSAATGTGASSINELIDGRSDFISVFLGQNAGANNSGSQNTGVGHLSLGSNSSGSQNSALGFFSLSANSTGSNNTSLGSFALQSNTTGSSNVGIGAFANHYNQNGNRNTIIGYQAGSGTTAHSKSDNVFLGYQAGYNETGSNKLYIANSSTSNPLIGGDFQLREISLNASVGIGTAPPSNGLEVADTIFASSGGFKFPDETIQITAVNFLDDLDDCIYDGSSIFIGSGTGTNDGGGTANTAIGYQAFFSNYSGENNIANGRECLFFNYSGDYNIANGYKALYLNSGGSTIPGPWIYKDGSYNIATGYQVMHENRYGAHNIATGFQALFSNTGFEGERERGDFNIAMGYQSLFYTVGGEVSPSAIACYNIGLGHEVLYNNTIGNGNIALGYRSGYTSEDGDYNTFIGHNADASSGSLTNATAIGYQAVVNASNKVRIGNTDVTVIEGQVDFTYTSDRNKKENFLDIDGEQVLQKIRPFKLQSWNYKHDAEKMRHYGPVAQDFFGAFGHDGIGEVGSDTTLMGSDVNGINMIAIQALEKRTSDLKQENTQLKQEISLLKSKIEKYESLFSKVEELTNPKNNQYARNKDNLK